MSNTQDEAVTRLDSAVAEVFETMLERSCDPLEGEVDTVEGRIVARIQFTGAVDGECLLYASQATASVTAEALLGTPSEPHDPMVDDAIGELCNMIAGGWKSKLASPTPTARFRLRPSLGMGSRDIRRSLGPNSAGSIRFRGTCSALYLPSREGTPPLVQGV